MNRSLNFAVWGALIYVSTMLAPAAAGVAKEGETVFTAKCKNCHGVDGTGNPAIAKMMNVTMKPWASATDADVKTAVTAGTGKMNPIAGLAAADLDNLIAYI